MSDSLIVAQPRSDDASKPMPDSNESSLKLEIGMVRWCQEPGKSVNRKSTNFTCSSTANLKTVFGSIRPGSSYPARSEIRVEISALEHIGDPQECQVTPSRGGGGPRPGRRTL